MFSNKTFNAEHDLESLTGKVAFVTGGKYVATFFLFFNSSLKYSSDTSRGIGYQTVKHLARRGATVYLGSRSKEAGNKAVADLEEEGTEKGKVVYTWCDFGTVEKAKESGEKLLRKVEKLDILGEYSLRIRWLLLMAYWCNSSFEWCCVSYGNGTRRMQEPDLTFSLISLADFRLKHLDGEQGHTFSMSMFLAQV
jgi:hypothetical protein